MFVWFCVVCASVSRAAAAGQVMTGQVMTGQPREVSVNSSRVWTAARFAVLQFNRDNDEDQFAYKIVNITSAKIQVVAGFNYILEMKLGRTICKNKDMTDSQTCVYHCEPKELLCHFIVTEIPWKDSAVLTQKQCHTLNN